MIAPKVFQLDEIDGHSSAAVEDVPADQEEQVREAAHSCPEQAIILAPSGGSASLSPEGERAAQ
jgi:ferredoxin